ncbi:hypothetical protein SLNSH_14375 [Alsobacter soli]|uniref:Uncharacterized protein n=1 Tax=Alsobacter soli TaxID=2109933 RepID=A0A2T1HRY6_9HYPH|nr:hypothetical protein SLNSH_14375 [Alsobacter soli]
MRRAISRARRPSRERRRRTQPRPRGPACPVPQRLPPSRRPFPCLRNGRPSFPDRPGHGVSVAGRWTSWPI